MKIRLLILLLLTLLTSCNFDKKKVLESKKADNNENYKVDYLFTHEGCKVYRFNDCGYYVYFTNCNGKTFTKLDTLDEALRQNMIRIEEEW